MQRVFHVLRSPRSRKLWIVRTDGVPDVVLQGEQVATDYARVVCQRLAESLGKPVVLRLWNVFERYVDELFVPSAGPRDSVRSRAA